MGTIIYGDEGENFWIKRSWGGESKGVVFNICNNKQGQYTEKEFTMKEFKELIKQMKRGLKI